jgi:Family of unknown function (DUF6338)
MQLKQETFMSDKVLDEVFGKLAWLFVLLPGFVSTAVLGFVAELPELSELQLSAYSLIASLACALIALPLAWAGSALARRLDLRRPSSPRVSLGLFGTLCLALGPLLGLYFGHALQNGYLLRLLATAPGITLIDKASSKRPLIHLLDLNNRSLMDAPSADGRDAALRRANSYARVRLKDGLSYEGWPLYYPHGDKGSEIYLSPACRIDDNEAAIPVPGPGVVVVEAELRALEFIDDVGSACQKALKPGSPPAASPRKG